jgi:hypothetical protein
MVERVAFDPKELEPVGYVPDIFPELPPTPVFNTPISRKENFMLFLKGEKPLWMPHARECIIINPSCVPDQWARGMVTRPNDPVSADQYGGKDMFGVEWEYLPSERGSMVRPGKYPVKDIEKWEDYVVFPDIDSWDWEKSAAETEGIRNDGRLVKVAFMTGLFERLISFVGMTDAMIAMIDEDAKPAIHRLFDKLCDLYDGIFERYAKYFKPDVIWFHDDWGSQRAPFFSLETVKEMILPYLKRCVDSAHKYGILFELHCCGKVEMLVPAMVEAGCDMWDGQEMNDKIKILQQYGDKIICDSIPDPLPPDASVEQKLENLKKYLKDYEGLRTYCGMYYGAPQDEYKLLYELSRKAFNE